MFVQIVMNNTLGYYGEASIYGRNISLACAGFFPSIGKAKLGTICSLSRQVFFQLPLIHILPLLWGMNGVLFAGPVADISAALFSLVIVTYELKKMREYKGMV